ncbi:MAG: lysozyme [Bacteroidales bacterium]|nr:lysozyme [Bacteroidales bacterium]
MKLIKEGLELIKHFEGYRGKPYKCPAGYLTIGYGHVIKSGENLSFLTEPEAEALLLSDIVEFSQGINKLIKAEINDNLYSACISLSYNIGLGAFARSTLLKNINNNKPILQKNFTDWCKIKGNKSIGLIIRRICEYQLATTGKWERNINKNNYKEYLIDV